VFEWILEVDEDALGDDRGRIQIIVEYQMNLHSQSPTEPQQQQPPPQKSHRRRGRRHRQRSTSSSSSFKDSASSSEGGSGGVYRSVQNRITAHVDIQRDNTYAIVPVVKVCILVSVTHTH